MARDDRRLGDTPEAIMWVLLRDAFRVSRFFAGTPRAGYPVKSAMPEAPDEITIWQKINAYIKGEVRSCPNTSQARSARAPRNAPAPITC